MPVPTIPSSQLRSPLSRLAVPLPTAGLGDVDAAGGARSWPGRWPRPCRAHKEEAAAAFACGTLGGALPLFPLHSNQSEPPPPASPHYNYPRARGGTSQGTLGHASKPLARWAPRLTSSASTAAPSSCGPAGSSPRPPARQPASAPHGALRSAARLKL